MSPDYTMTVAGQIARFLREKGVERVFGMPGGETLLLLEALKSQDIDFILMHHEVNAGFAADATGQLTGRPGVCLSTLGPGAVNLAAAAAGATLERSPVLAITAEFDPAIQRRVTHMQVDLGKLFGTVSKGSFSLRPEDALGRLEEAWELACSHPYGAVHLALSPETAGASTPSQPHPPDEKLPLQTSEEQLAAAVEKIERAERIYLLVGLGMEASTSVGNLMKLAEAWEAPVIVTPKAKGVVPEDHPLYAGCYSAYGDRPIREALRQSDLILGVGLDGVDFVTATWDIPTPLVNLDPAGRQDPVTRPEITLAGQLGAVLDRLRHVRRVSQDGASQAAGLREAVLAELDTGFPAGSGFVRLLPLIEGLRTALPPDGAVTLDVGVFKLVFLQRWRTNLPKTLFVANGLSAMGYAIPAALAIRLERPSQPVVAVVGDGALHMYAGELATLGRLKVPLVVLVVVDRALALIRLKQLRMDLPYIGTEFGDTDYAALARAFDLGYRNLDEESSIQAVLLESLSQSQPILVEARVPLDEYDHFR